MIHYESKNEMYPSGVNYSYRTIFKCNRKLNDVDIDDLKKSIHLHSQGLNIAALIYLKRVTERFLFETYKESQGLIRYVSLIINENNFNTLKFNHKVNILKYCLPEDFINMNDEISSIIDKELCELEEDECRKIFPEIMTFIEKAFNYELDEVVITKRIQKSINEQHIDDFLENKITSQE